MHPLDEAMPAKLLAQAIRDVDGLMCVGQRVGQDILEVAAELRVIANVAVGYDNIDVETCTRRGILVTNTPDVLTEATADVAFALIMAVARRVVEGDRYVREGCWSSWQWNAMWGADLHGKTLGLYGFGRIAQAVARRGRGFSMRILYHARHRADERIEKELAAECVDGETLLRESDFLSLHVPSYSRDSPCHQRIAFSVDEANRVSHQHSARPRRGRSGPGSGSSGGHNCGRRSRCFRR